MQTHPAADTVIKRAAVDLEMVSVVNWLNSFPEVYTRYSCQGDDRTQPYVIFFCWDDLQLIRVLDFIGHAGAVEIEWQREWRTLRYYLRFHTRETFALFRRRLAAPQFDEVV